MVAIFHYFSSYNRRYFRILEVLIGFYLKVMFNILPWFFRENEVKAELIQKRSIKMKNQTNNLQVLLVQVIETLSYTIVGKVGELIIITILNLIYSDNISDEIIHRNREKLEEIFSNKKNQGKENSKAIKNIKRLKCILRSFIIFSKLLKKIRGKIEQNKAISQREDSSVEIEIDTNQKSLETQKNDKISSNTKLKHLFIKRETVNQKDASSKNLYLFNKSTKKIVILK